MDWRPVEAGGAYGRLEGARPGVHTEGLCHPLSGLALLALALTALLVWPPLADSASPRVLIATVLRVSDGESLVALTRNQALLRVRLLGIHAPALPTGTAPGKPYGREAKQALENLVEGKSVQVEHYGRNRRREVLGVVIADGININIELVWRGLAAVDRRTRCRAYCRELKRTEAVARQAHRGMWGRGAVERRPAAGAGVRRRVE